MIDGFFIVLVMVGSLPGKHQIESLFLKRNEKKIFQRMNVENVRSIESTERHEHRNQHFVGKPSSKETENIHIFDSQH